MCVYDRSRAFKEMMQKSSKRVRGAVLNFIRQEAIFQNIKLDTLKLRLEIVFVVSHTEKGI